MVRMRVAVAVRVMVRVMARVAGVRVSDRRDAKSTDQGKG